MHDLHSVNFFTVCEVAGERVLRGEAVSIADGSLDLGAACRHSTAPVTRTS